MCFYTAIVRLHSVHDSLLHFQVRDEIVAADIPSVVSARKITTIAKVGNKYRRDTIVPTDTSDIP